VSFLRAKPFVFIQDNENLGIENGKDFAWDGSIASNESGKLAKIEHLAWDGGVSDELKHLVGAEAPERSFLGHQRAIYRDESVGRRDGLERLAHSQGREYNVASGNWQMIIGPATTDAGATDS